jgi:hypothetical protein
MSIEVYSESSFAEIMDDRPELNGRLLEIHEQMKPYLALLNVRHVGYDGRLKQGQTIVHKAMYDTFKNLFAKLLDLRFPIQQIVPMNAYGWNDARAMAANNTSVYRPSFIGDPSRGKASEHTRGTALDLNPLDNPLINPGGSIEPKEAVGHSAREDVVIFGRRLDVIGLFNVAGFEYGGYWNDPSHPTDYYGIELSDRHHFELRPAAATVLRVPPNVWA